MLFTRQSWEEALGCEVLSCGLSADRWVVEFRAQRSGKTYRVVFQYCRGFQDVYWKLQPVDDTTRKLAESVIHIPHSRMAKVYPQIVPQAVKFFTEVVLPHILTRYPEL